MERRTGAITHTRHTPALRPLGPVHLVATGSLLAFGGYSLYHQFLFTCEGSPTITSIANTKVGLNELESVAFA
jgi:hypothetical protein